MQEILTLIDYLLLFVAAKPIPYKQPFNLGLDIFDFLSLSCHCALIFCSVFTL